MPNNSTTKLKIVVEKTVKCGKIVNGKNLTNFFERMYTNERS